jgi:hypothetical protein
MSSRLEPSELGARVSEAMPDEAFISLKKRIDDNTFLKLNYGQQVRLISRALQKCPNQYEVLNLLTESGVLNAPTTLEECTMLKVAYNGPEEARNILLGRNIVDVVLLCTKPRGVSIEVLGKVVEKLNPEDAEEFARRLTHCHSDNGKRIAESLFKDGIPENLTSERFREIASEPHADRVVPTLHFDVREASKNGSKFNTEVRELKEELKDVIASACEYCAMVASVSNTQDAWQRIANEVAVRCFGEDGKTNVANVYKLALAIRGMMNGPNSEEWPSAMQMCSQMLYILTNLICEESDLRNSLDQAKQIELSKNGREILKIMSNSAGKQLTPGQAMLASLLTPHVQLPLPTCTINSLINWLILNKSSELVNIFSDMLDRNKLEQGTGQSAFTLPGGRLVSKVGISDDGTVTVDLSQGGRGRDAVFSKTEAMELWGSYGIKYDGSEPHKLGIEVRNLTDILFANLLQTTFGDSAINSSCDYGVPLVYSGHESDDLSPVIGWSQLGGKNAVDILKAYAWQQKKQGMHCMRVATKGEGGSSVHGHAEILYINAVLSIGDSEKNPNVVAIGSRNWIWPDGEVVSLVFDPTGGSALDGEFGSGSWGNDGQVYTGSPSDAIGSFRIYRPIGSFT